MNVVVAIFILLFGVVRCDISQTNPPSDICLCVDSRTCIVRDSGCGDVTGITTKNNCYIFTGQKTDCSLSGQIVSYFETIFNGKSGWIDGIDLIFGVGPECGIPDECSSVNCQNGGNCFNQIDGYVCDCVPGFGGSQCEMNINECQSNPCLNGATCNDLVNGYKCDCTPGYIGTTCEKYIGDLILRNTAAGSDSYYFYRNWSEYRQGFGTIDSLYWIGLDWLHEASQRGCAVRFDLQALNGTWYYAQYSTFLVGDLADYYRLTVEGFTGNVDDTLTSFHNNMQFSTYDYGPARGCGTTFYGGWWYKACCTVCLTISPSNDFHWTFDDFTMVLNAAEVRFVC